MHSSSGESTSNLCSRELDDEKEEEYEELIKEDNFPETIINQVSCFSLS